MALRKRYRPTPFWYRSRIIIINPNEDGIYVRGNTYAIDWNYTGGAGSTVTLKLFQGGVLISTLVSDSNDFTLLAPG